MDQAHQRLLDDNYRFQRHVYDVTREYYLLGRDRLIDTLEPPDRGSILEIGCGTARNLIRMSRRYPRCDLFGIDLSSAMLETAESSLARRGLRGRVTLAHGDASAFEPYAAFGRQTFDRIVFSYTLSMIPRWQDALEIAVRSLPPGGSLHVVDFGTGRELPGFFSAALRSWLAHFHVTPRDQLTEHLQRLASGSGAKVEFTPLFRTYAVSAVLTRG